MSVLLQSFVRAGRAGGGNNLPQSYWWTKKSVSAPTNAIERERDKKSTEEDEKNERLCGRPSRTDGGGQKIETKHLS